MALMEGPELKVKAAFIMPFKTHFFVSKALKTYKKSLLKAKAKSSKVKPSASISNSITCSPWRGTINTTTL